ncbi:MAG: magnesium protoporphyrin IX methyltransferase [Parvularculaceae bacterium]
MNASSTYALRRAQLETYFDRTAMEAWAKLTSDAPVSGVRATVRAGRDAMRETLLSWLPTDLSGRRILDAGCGAGQFAMAAASRGASVVAVDVSARLVALAEERLKETPASAGEVRFVVGDMLDPAHGRFDHVVAMDSLIHYRAEDVVRVLRGLGSRVEQSILFTFAPSTPLLATMHRVGKLFPRSDRAPAIEPVAPRRLNERIGADAALSGFAPMRSRRVSSGFYISEAMELARR